MDFASAVMLRSNSVGYLYKGYICHHISTYAVMCVYIPPNTATTPFTREVYTQRGQRSNLKFTTIHTKSMVMSLSVWCLSHPRITYLKLVLNLIQKWLHGVLKVDYIIEYIRKLTFVHNFFGNIFTSILKHMRLFHVPTKWNWLNFIFAHFLIRVKIVLCICIFV